MTYTFNDYTIFAWDLSKITASTNSLFADNATGSLYARGATFSIASGATVNQITVRDNDSCFNDGDLDQTLNSNETLEGSSYTSASGRITPEYAYTVAPAGCTDPAQYITVYAFEMADNDMVGIVSNAALKTGVTYTVISCTDNCPSVPYSCLATYPIADGIVEGTAGNDLIDSRYTGDPERDMIDANDYRGGNADSVVAGAGNDTILSGAAADTVHGEDGNDLIDGGADNDLLFGGNGDDTFVGGAGNDTFNGGTGLDVIDYSHSGAAVNVNLNTGALSGGDAAGDSIASGIDGVIGSDYNDSLVGFDHQGTTPADTYTNVFHGMDGNDTILGMGSDDSLYGGADNDSIEGGAGNDYIEGDGDLDAGAASVDLTMDWQRFSQTCGNITNGSSYDMGGVRVTFGFTDQTCGATATSTTAAQYVEAGDGLNGAGGLQLYGNGGAGNTSTTSLTFGSTNADYASAVTDVSFRINDIDVGNACDYHQDIVTVRAYDAQGHLLNVTYTVEGAQTVANGTVTGHDVDNGGLSPASAQGSVLVTIDGVVARIEIDYNNGGSSDQAITVTDLTCSTVPAVEADEAGDDTLSGGEGDDTILGQGGNDTITGGAGHDRISAGDDRDLIRGAAGDTIDGGAGGDDYDTLDITGQGDWRVINRTVDSNGNGYNGTVQFLDADGNVTGALDFTEIENITGDRVNHRPDAVNDTATTSEDHATTINVLGNDTDPDGDALTVTGATALHGTVTINANGTLTYTPNANYNGTDTITYTVRDPAGLTDTATVNMTVTPVNDAPDAVNDTASTNFQTAVTVPVLANDTDIDGDTLTVTGATSPNGTVTINANGTITFTPANGFSGPATITYTISDGHGGTDTATVTVTVGADPRDGVVEGTAGNDLIDYDYTGDPEGDRIDHGDAILPGQGPEDDIVEAGAGNDTVRSGAGNDSINAGTGNDSVDGGVGNDTALGGDGNDTLQGGAGNDSLVGGLGYDSLDGGADNDTLAGNEGRDTLVGGAGNDSLDGGADDDSLTGGTGNDTLKGELGNDTLIGGDGNDLADGGEGNDLIDTSGTGGTPDIGYPGQYGADANPNDDRDTVIAGTGDDTIRTGDDADSIDAGQGNDVIDAGIDADTVQAGMGDDLVIGGEGSDSLTGGDGNDTIYADNGPGTTNPTEIPDATDAAPNNGDDTVFGGAGNDVIYGGDDSDLLSGDAGNDTLDGGIDDDTLLGGDGLDSLLGGDGRDSLSGGTGADTLVGGAGADTVAGGDDRDLINGTAGDVVDGGAGGDDYDTLDLTGQGAWRLVNTTTDSNGNGINGTVEFLDVHGAVTGSLNFTEIERVVGDQVGPVANDDTATVEEDHSVTINVLGNDTDANGDTLTVTAAASPNGSVTINPNGTLTFTPAANYNGPATITYTVSDGHGGTDTATVNVTVTPVNDAPDAVNDTASTNFQTAVTVPVLANDTDVDGDALTVTGATSPNGTVTVNPNGTITFTPATGFSGPATITYTISDGHGGTDTATVTVTVGADPRDGYVDGTATGDLIDTSYTGDPQGDRVDANDAILPGDAPNDDRIRAGAGNDTVLAGLGDDTVWAGTGNDSVEGGDGDDSLLGEGGADTLRGGDGNDTVDGGDDNDLVIGGSGDDLVIGGLGNDTLEGVAGNDTARGGAGDDSITTGRGSDLVEGGDGNDVINTRNDAASPDIAYPGLYPADTDPNDDRDTVFGGAGNDSILTGDDADSVDGGTGNDTIDSGVDADTVSGGDGDDSITSGCGSDVVDGGAGNDTIYGGLGPTVPDVINIPDATDLVPNNGRDTIHGGDGNDVIYGEDDDDRLYGDAGNDTLDGGIDEDTIEGGAGNDSIIGGQGADVLAGGDDRDTFRVATLVAGAGDVIDGNEGGDDYDTLDLTGAGRVNIVYDPTNAENGTVEFLDTNGLVVGTLTFSNIENIITDGDGIVEGTDGADLIDYNYTGDPEGDMIDHNDALIPGDGPQDDRVVAGAGNDTILSGVGDDTVDAGAGDDSVQAGSGDDSVLGGAGNDTILGESGDDTLDGGLGNDSIIGGLDDDSILGGDGNDTLDGRAGLDTIDGGAGNDSIDGGDGNDSVTGGTGNDTLYGELGDDTLTGGDGRDLVDGGDGADLIDTSGTGGSPDIAYPGLYGADSDPTNDRDTVIAGTGNDTIRTGDDADSIDAGQGNDVIDAGDDADTVQAGIGDDLVIGGEGSDSITGGDGNDTIYADIAQGTTSPTEVEDATDPVPQNGMDTVHGGEGNDVIYGGDDDDVLSGDNGNDYIDGGIDEDTITGGEGNDTLIGGAGADSLDGGSASDTLDGGSGNDTLAGGEGDDSILGGAGDDLADGGTGQDTIRGGEGNDTLTGGDGDDRVYGDAGNDSLAGGQGQDLLDGGIGNDTLQSDDGVDTLIGGDDRDTFIVNSRDAGNNDSIDGNEGGDDWDTLDLTDAGPLRINYDPTNHENGTVSFLDDHGNVTGSLTFKNIENVIPPCFTPGTLVATPRGERLVEELREGDKILTRDNGIQEIRWIGRTDLTRSQLMASPHLKPVLIKAGSLGNGLPERDMLVSPNHRMLVANERTALYFEEHEVLVAAKHLVDNRGVMTVETLGTSYIHFMFDRHEVVLGNGAWTESFQPGDHSLEGLGNAQRAEILELFPELRTREGLESYSAARKTLKKHEAALLKHR